MLTKEIRTAIIERLTEEFSGREALIETFPLNPTRYEFTHNRITVFVRFADRSGGQPEMSGQQSMVILLELTIYVRTTVTQDEIDDFRDRLINTLSTFYPNEKYERPYCISDSTLNYKKEGFFLYGQRYEINGLLFPGEI